MIASKQPVANGALQLLASNRTQISAAGISTPDTEGVALNPLLHAVNSWNRLRPTLRGLNMVGGRRVVVGGLWRTPESSRVTRRSTMGGNYATVAGGVG